MKAFIAIFLALSLGNLLASAAKYTDSQCRGKLSAAGIPVWSEGKCSNRYGGLRCTSFDQIQQNTCNCIIVLKRASKCPITVTGGTEFGHATSTYYSHFNGYKLDISLNTCINNYITRSFKYIGKRPAGGVLQYRSSSGNIYARERNHWDITYYKC